MAGGACVDVHPPHFPHCEIDRVHAGARDIKCVERRHSLGISDKGGESILWRFDMLSTRYVTHVLLVICLATNVSLSQTQTVLSNTSKPEDQVAQLEHDWLAADAKGDAARLRQIIADDFIGSSFNGSLLSKEDIIPEGTGPGGFAGATTGDTTVRIFGDTGVLMGSLNNAGASPAKQIHITLVCQKKPQGWKIIAAHLTQMQ